MTTLIITEHFRFKRFRAGLAVSVLSSIAILSIAAGPYPEPLSTVKEIRTANPTTDSIDIRYLPLADYPLLSKFVALKRIEMWSQEGTSATDDKLKAIANIGFTNLNNIDLNDCPLISDQGIEALSKIRSLKGLELEGTSITDAACHVMASRMSLTSVQISNCSGVTKNGIEALSQSQTLDTFLFSADKLTQEEVLKLIDSFKGITWCEIVDTAGKLDANAIRAKGKERNIHVSVRRTGALQEMKQYPGD